MYNYKMILTYDGSNYNGWQKQKNTEKTIQEALELAIKNIIKENIEIIGSGRTDKGVHALGQVANFQTKNQYDVKELKNHLNKELRNDITILKISEEDERFHSRYNTKSKTYIYKINNSETQNPFVRKYTYHLPEKLNIQKMKEASKFLIGEKDFQVFSSARNNKKNTVKTIENIEILSENNEILIRFKGNGFLYNQVRIMVGTLIEIGLEKHKPNYINDIFNKKERSFAGRTIPPHGLYLEKVYY